MFSNVLFCRLLLAALHYNHNANRETARRSDGLERYSVRYPRFRKGAWVVVPIKEKASYGRQCHAVLSYFDICAQDICDIDLYTVFYHYYVCRLCNVINRGPSGELHGFTQGSSRG